MAIEIYLDDNYAITSNAANFILNEVKVAQKDTKDYDEGDEYLYPIGYYGNLGVLLKNYVNRSCMESDCEEVEELVSLLKKLNRNCERIAKKFDVKVVKE